MKPKYIYVITHQLATPPGSLKDKALTMDEIGVIISLKKSIYNVLCNPKKIYFLTPRTNRCEQFGWELVKNCPLYRFQAYYGNAEDNFFYDLSLTLRNEDAFASFVVVSMNLFNDTCRQIHADAFGKWRKFKFTYDDLSYGAICTFDLERGDAHVLTLG